MQNPVEDKNWLNVGNWHWKSRNTLPWMKDFLCNELIGLSFSSAPGDLLCQLYDSIATSSSSPLAGIYKLTKVDKISGDCDLCVRKSRLLPIYDIGLQISWSLLRKNQQDSLIDGTISIHDLTNDSANSSSGDDLSVTVAVEKWVNGKSLTTQQQYNVEQAVKTILLPEIRRVFSKITDRMIQEQSGDLYNPDAVASVDLPLKFQNTESGFIVATNTPQIQKTMASAAECSPQIAQSLQKNVKNTESSNHVYFETFCEDSVAFNAPFAAIVECFTVQNKMRCWAGADAQCDSGNLVFLGGKVKGSISKVSDESLQMNWKIDGSDPCLININDLGEGKVQYMVEKIPKGNKSRVEALLQTITDRIRGAFGYGPLCF